MEIKSKLDKSIYSLKKITEQHNKQIEFKFSDDAIIIDNNTSQFYGTIFYLILTILIPVAIQVYFIFFARDYFIIFILSILELLFLYNFYKMTNGDRILTINLKEKYFQSDNINAIFKCFFQSVRIPFSELTNVYLNEESIYHKTGSTRWNQLTITTKEQKDIVLINFRNDDSEKHIVQKIKNLIEILISIEK